MNVDPKAEKYYSMSPYTCIGNNPFNVIGPDGRYLFGLFGSSASERRMGRAEAFAEKTGGSVVIGENGKPTVNYLTKDESGYTINSTSKFGDFSSWKNFGQTLKGFDKALEGSSDGANYGGKYGGVDGMRKYGEDISNSSTYVKAGGVVVAGIGTGSLQPEVVAGGMVMYDIGATMDDVGTGVQAYSDVVDAVNGKAGSTTNTLVRTSALITGKVVDNAMDNSSLNSTNKFVGKVTGGIVVDQVKDASLTKEKKTKQLIMSIITGLIMVGVGIVAIIFTFKNNDSQFFSSDLKGYIGGLLLIIIGILFALNEITW